MTDLAFFCVRTVVYKRSLRAMRTPPTVTSLTVGAGGFLGLYLLGIASHLREHHRLTDVRIGGVSAGAVVAGYLLSEHRADELLRSTTLPRLRAEVDAAHGANALWPRVPRIVRDALTPLDDMDVARGYVAVSRVGGRPLIVSELRDGFASVDEYIDYAVLSSFVPILCGRLAMPYHDTSYVDGALTSRAPVPVDCDPTRNLFVHPGMFGRRFSWSDSSQVDARNIYRLVALGRRDAARHRNVFAGLAPRTK